MKKQVKVMGILAVWGICFGLFGALGNMRYVEAREDAAVVQLPEGAAEISELSQLMTAKEAVDMKSAPKDGAEVIRSYQEGESVFVTGETDNGWYRVLYQDKEGYIPKECLSIQEMDVAALNEEMAREEREGQLIMETVERYRADARRSKIWGSLIVVLVLGIFAVGVVSSVKSSKNKEEQKEV